MALPAELRDGRIGPFPVWAIGVALAGGIVLFMYLRSRSATGVDTSERTPELESIDGIPTMSFADEISDRFPQNVSLAPLPSRPETNAQWLIAAFDYLAGMGKDPAMVQRALQNYLQGKTLTNAEWQLVNVATSNSALSLPPEGVNLAPLPPGPGTPDPGTPGTPPSTVPTHVPVPLEYNLYQWVEELNRGYGLNLTFVRMFGSFKGDPTALNPMARNYMRWDGSGTKVPVFGRQTPPMRIR